MKNKIIFLMGPTASGKTDLAIKLIQDFPLDIISVDSALIYKGMDIGTAKPSEEELSLAPHRLINIIDPKHTYSVANFRMDALKEIKLVWDKGRVPILVGGTMLYFKSLVDGLSNLPESNPLIRANLENLLINKGINFLYEQLKILDVETASKLHPNDTQRILRALEVCEISKKTMSELLRERKQNFELNPLQLALLPEDRKKLHDKIEKRFLDMIKKGFIEEVETLFSRGDLKSNMPSIRAVGYRQIWKYLQGEYLLDEAVYRAICATRQLAKRQITWLRSWNNLNIVDPYKYDDVNLLVNNYLNS